MSRIDRKAVGADVQAIASLVDRPLALMAIPAQRAQRPQHKGVVIALMRRVMVSDRRRRQAASFLAQDAKRFDLHLVPGAPAPALQRVPGTPVKRLSRGEVAGVHGGKGATNGLGQEPDDRDAVTL